MRLAGPLRQAGSAAPASPPLGGNDRS